MDQFPQIDPGLSKALTLFLEELRAHLQFFEKLTQQKNLTLDLTWLKEAEHRMHLIKGGAGFFKFSTIQTFAKENESYFKEQSPKDPLAKITQINSTLKQFSENLEKHYLT